MWKASLIGALALGYIMTPHTPIEAVELAIEVKDPWVKARLPALVDDVVAVAATRPLFDGARGVDATALLLVAIFSSESSFRQDVEDCSVLGDHGRAFGLPQLHAEWFVDRYSVAEFCGSRTLQIKIALDHVWTERAHCGGGPGSWMGGYHMGTSCILDAVSAGYGHMFTRLLGQAGISLHHDRRTDAYRAE